MEKYPHSAEKKKHHKHHQEHLDSRLGKSEGPVGFNYEETVKNLNKYYRLVKRQVLRYQNPVTGLFPCDLSRPEEAHVRDSVYCSAAVWALSQAYKRIDDDKGRTYELAQSAVKCMRGILKCWIRQAEKVEKFKKNQNEKNALHSRFNIKTCSAIYRDDEAEHLQIDCIALYIIFLVQMITSGLQIIFTADEVTFVQNLVFYVERAYRTPDFGMWERGSKYNNGSSELHASSIGYCKAALESMNGENLFGTAGASWSIVYVDIDAHNRNRTVFETLLPRESASKNTDASLIPTVSWPAFAVHEEGLVARTIDKASRKLAGHYGMKRFLRDGFGTVMEDRSRKYYRAAEIKEFDGIESEWPMFFAYLLIDSAYKGDQAKMDHYQEKLKSLLLYTDDGFPVLPKFYFVEPDCTAAERAHPGSQRRLANNFADKELHLWGQSVYIISQLLGLLGLHDLDPLSRHLPSHLRPVFNPRYSSFKSSPADLVIQVVLIAESTRLQQTLATYGIQSQTPHQIEPIQIWPPSELAKGYCGLGVNQKLGLSGRPARPIGGLGTAKIYRTSGMTFLCYPLIFEVTDFYLSTDMELVIDDVKTELAFLGKCWKLAGRPTFCMIIREDNIRGTNGHHLFQLLAQFKRGSCEGIKVRMGRLQEFIQSACIEHLDFLDLYSALENEYLHVTEKEASKQFRSLTEIYKISSVQREVETWANYQDLVKRNNWDLAQELMNTDNLYAQAQILQVLLNKEGLYHRIEEKTVEERLDALLRKCCSLQLWSLVRFISSLLSKVVDSLAPSITAILVRGKQVTIGVFGKEEEVIDKPLSPHEIKNILYSKCFPHDAAQAVLQQELILNIGKLISTVPKYFSGILKIRVGWIIQAMKLELTYSERDKEVSINSLSPSAIKKLLRQVLQKNPPNLKRSVIWDRQLDGALNRVPPGFYDEVWSILARTPQGLKVAGYLLPQQPTLSDMTQYELNFSLLVEQMLSKIVDPAYRQIIVECFMVLSTILERNKELSFKGSVDLDKTVHQAFQLFQTARRSEGEEKGDDMNSFYNTAPNVQHGTSTYIAKAILNTLLDGNVHMHHDSQCTVS